MAVGIGGWAREVLQSPGVFGTLSTLQPDGSPLQAVVWFALRGDDLLVNSAVGRRWPANLQRDPRFSLLVGAGYEWVAVRGVAETLRDPEQAQEDIAALAREYMADDPEGAEQLIRGYFRTQERISFLLHPTALTEHPA
jgi:PPOX class probable F420-dependent enzyme